MPARTSSFLLFFLPSFGELLKKKFGFNVAKPIYQFARTLEPRMDVSSPLICSSFALWRDMRD
jgi:hypothetical protein